MRARNLKPGFFENEDLAELPFEGRLLFAGLWLLVDREGRMEDRPKRIKGKIFPFDSVDVDKLLRQLAEYNFIIRYEISGQSYIQVSSFSKHQSPHWQEKPSLIPPPNGYKSEINPSLNDGQILDNGAVDDRLNPEVIPDKSQINTSLNGGQIPPDSLILRFSDSLNPDCGKEREKTNKAKSARSNLPDDAFIEALKANPAYSHIDIDRELAKMDAWLLTPKGRGRKKTRQFIVNWLNKIDVPVQTKQNKPEFVY